MNQWPSTRYTVSSDIAGNEYSAKGVFAMLTRKGTDALQKELPGRAMLELNVSLI